MSLRRDLAMGDVTRLPVEKVYPGLLRPRDIWASPQPSAGMAWEVCPYLRRGDPCHHCEEEVHPNYGPGTRMCRLMAEEACRVVMAMQRREPATP